jgi:hypothetical protein
MQLGIIQDLIALLPMENILPLMLFGPLVAAFFAYMLGIHTQHGAIWELECNLADLFGR